MSKLQTSSNVANVVIAGVAVISLIATSRALIDQSKSDKKTLDEISIQASSSQINAQAATVEATALQQQANLLQSEVDQEERLADVNYEPQLTIQFSKPNLDSISWLSFINNAKTNVQLYTDYLVVNNNTSSTFDPTQFIVTNSYPAILTPGSIQYDSNSGDIDLLNQVMTESDANTNIWIYEYFKTADGQKYILETSISLVFSSNGNYINTNPPEYLQYNWKE